MAGKLLEIHWVIDASSTFPSAMLIKAVAGPIVVLVIIVIPTESSTLVLLQERGVALDVRACSATSDSMTTTTTTVSIAMPKHAIIQSVSSCNPVRTIPAIAIIIIGLANDGLKSPQTLLIRQLATQAHLDGFLDHDPLFLLERVLDHELRLQEHGVVFVIELGEQGFDARVAVRESRFANVVAGHAHVEGDDVGPFVAGLVGWLVIDLV